MAICLRLLLEVASCSSVIGPSGSSAFLSFVAGAGRAGRTTRAATNAASSRRDMAVLRRCRVASGRRGRYTQLPTAGLRMLPSRREFVTQATALGSVAATWLLARDARGGGAVSGLHFP